LFYSNLFSLFGSWFVFLCGRFKKKNLIPKDKNNQPKAQEIENFVSRRYFVRANASVYLQNERRSQNSLSFYSVCFSFVGVYWFITKTDTHYRESALFFWSRACIFSTSSSSKKRRGKFFFGLSERLGRNKCPSSELCSHVHERLWMKRVWFLTTRRRFEKVFT
jgi:hypothetical protein